MIPWCEAYVPLPEAFTTRGGPVFVPCRAPAVAAYRYRCAWNHELTRSVCAEHDPVPGNVGCYVCKQAGREVPMTWQLVEVAAAPPRQ